MTVHSGFTLSDSPSREPKSQQLRLNSPSLPSTERGNAFPDFSTGTKKVFTRSQWSICWVENVLPNWKVHDSHVLSTTATHMSQAYGCFPKTLNSSGSGVWLIHHLRAFRTLKCPPLRCLLLLNCSFHLSPWSPLFSASFYFFPPSLF